MSTISKTNSIKTNIYFFAVIGVAVYVLIYEMAFFFRDDSSFTFITKIIKMIFPFSLLLFVGLNPVPLIQKNKYVFYYVLFYLLFLIALFIPNILKEDIIFGMVNWLEMLPRFFFFIGLICLFYRSRYALIQSRKIFIIFSVLTVLLHLLYYVIPDQLDQIYFKTIQIRLPLKVPIYRLVGFFNEPSNASAFIFASFFLAKTLYNNNRMTFWSLAGIICFIGGLLALSNAGFASLGLAYIFGAIYNTRKHNNKYRIMISFISLTIAISLTVFALYGRYYAYSSNTDSLLLKALTGAIYVGDVDGQTFDFTGGRTALAITTLKIIEQSPMGYGFAPANISPAGAPLLWLLYAGIPGLIFILFRELTWVLYAIKNNKYSKIILYNSQALIIVVVQQSIYGQWNNAFYYFLVANLFVDSIQHYKLKQ